MIKPTGSEFAAQAAKYIGTPYANPPKGLKCDSLVEACLGDCGYKIDKAGTNTMAREKNFIEWVGTPEECKQKFGSIPVGACPMIWANDGREPEKYRNDGIGNYSHIGIKTGTGLGAIHASATKEKVCESKFADKTIPGGGWNRVALLAMLDYGDRVRSILDGDEPDSLNDNAVIVSDNGKSVNMRNSPGMNGSIVQTLPVGTKLIVLEKTNADWWKVCVEQSTASGYVMQKFVRISDTFEEDDPEGEEPMSNKVTVKTGNGKSLNLRQDKNSYAHVLAQIPDGTTLEVLDGNSEWLKVKYDGKTGYVMSRFTVPVEKKTLESRVKELEDTVAAMKLDIERISNDESRWG